MSKHFMTPEFCLKLGLLMGILDGFLIRVETGETIEGDTTRVRDLIKDVKKKFFESVAKAEASGGESNG